MNDVLNTFLNTISIVISQFEAMLFYKIPLSTNAHLPFLIFFLLFFSIIFAVRIGFLNFKFLPRAFVWCFSNKYEHNRVSISPKKIVFTALGSNIDLGSVFGVALGVSIGGAGVIFWFFVGAILSTSIRLIETFITHRYRHDVGQGGPQVYIKKIFANKNMFSIGKILSALCGMLFICSTVFSPQVNQTVELIVNNTFNIPDYRYLVTMIFTLAVIFIVMRDIKIISDVMSKIVPLMTGLYFICTFIVIYYHKENLLTCLKLIFTEAISFRNVNGNILGCLVIGVQRAFFCNEVGMGSVAIAHASSQNQDSFKEAVISMVSSVLSVCIVCICSGLVVIVTNMHQTHASQGITIIIEAFSSVHPYLNLIVLLVVPLFGFTTSIAWCYAGLKIWMNLFGEKNTNIFYILIFVGYMYCGMNTDFGVVLQIADMMNLAVTIPNIIALWFGIGQVKHVIKTASKKH